MKPTKKQMQLLKVLNPYQEKKVTQKDAARILGIDIQAVKDRISRLKVRCPEIYENFKRLSKDMASGQEAVSKARIVDPEDFNYFKIKEIF